MPLGLRGTKRRNFIRFFAAKTYDPNEARNPLFPRPRSNKRVWLALCVFMLVATVIAGVGVLIYGPYLRVNDVVVDGAVTLSPEELALKVKEQFAERNWLILPNDHQWFFNHRAATEALLNNFPLASAQVAREGTTIRVTVAEDIFMVAFRSGEEVYFLNDSGVVMRVASPEEKAAVLVKVGAVDAPVAGEGGLAVLHEDMPVLREKTPATRAVGDQVFKAERIEAVIDFMAGLRSLNIAAREFVSDDVSLPWFAITSDKDYLVLFDATKSSEQQLTLLKTVLDEYFATQEATPQYIDVRFGNRVYVR